MKTCQKCGAEYNDNQKFCFNCGCRIGKKKNSKMWVLLALVVAVCFGLFMFFEQSAKTVAVKDIDYLAPVKVEDKWGYINTRCEMVIEPQFKYAQMFCNGYAVVSGLDVNTNSYKCGVINRQGNYVIEPKYAFMHRASDGLNIFEVYDDVCANDYSPEYPHRYVDLTDKLLFGGRLFAYESENMPNIFFVGENGHVVEYKEMKNSKIISYRNLKGGEIFSINSEEEALLDFPKKDFWPIYCEKNDGYYDRYIINDKFEKVLSLPRWEITGDEFWYFYGCHGGLSCGRCVYCTGEGWKNGKNLKQFCIADERGKVIKKVCLLDLWPYSNGYAYFRGVNKDGKFEQGFLDVNGNVVLCYVGDDVKCWTWMLGENGMIKIEKNGKYGCVNIRGEEIIPCQYDVAIDFGK